MSEAMNDEMFKQDPCSHRAGDLLEETRLTQMEQVRSKDFRVGQKFKPGALWAGFLGRPKLSPEGNV